MSENLSPQLLALNFCKNPLCADFGSLNAANYSLSSATNNPQIACINCHSISPIIWPTELNHEVTAQLEHNHAGLTACTSEQCVNVGLNVQLHPNRYYAFGFSGDKQRYRCKNCQKTIVDRFSVENPNLKTHVTILALLLTGFSLKEIAAKLKIQAKTLNDHIKVMATICRQKSSVFDHHWKNKGQKFLLGSDWTFLQPKSQNGVLWVCTGDLDSHYIAQQSLNLSEQKITINHRFIGSDFLASINTAPPAPKTEALKDIIESLNVAHQERTHLNNPLHNQTQLNYPAKSSLVSPIYCTAAHYLQLNQALGNKEQVMLSMSFEPMLADAAMLSFNAMRQKQSLDLLYQVEDESWTEGKTGNKPQLLRFEDSAPPWSLSEQWHLRGKADQRAICQLVESNLTQKQAHQLPKLSSITHYMDRFHAMFKSSVNEPRRKRRPEGLLPLLDIYRAWNNLCHQENPGETPAVNAGISEKPLSLDQLLQ
ncbi:IS1 family transposase [Vibrio comitans]|uniref:Transposase n=1 Tax=Vibrio comitans NBRC 102076 TaxID=1219078 RepID=A0A4Y3IMY3_9VIBR|nr:IS1 family transposase [Vibrio comitans]GEA60859.1 transposase [Vibrio comitans NBRC 102076]